MAPPALVALVPMVPMVPVVPVPVVLVLVELLDEAVPVVEVVPVEPALVAELALAPRGLAQLQSSPRQLKRPPQLLGFLHAVAVSQTVAWTLKVLQKPLRQSASTSQGVQMPEGGPLCTFTWPVLPLLALEALAVLPCVPELDPWVPMVLWPVEPADVLAPLEAVEFAVPVPAVPVPAVSPLQPMPSASSPHRHDIVIRAL